MMACDRAIKECDKAIALNPNHANAYSNRGLAYHDKGEYDRAIEDYNKAIDLDRDYARAYNNRGLAYYDKGNSDRAIEDYNKAIDLDPNHARAYLNRGLAYHDKGDSDRAIEDYDNAVGCPDYQTDLIDRDLVHGRDAARAAIRLLRSKIDSFCSKNADYYYYRGVRELFWNDRDNAREDFEEALKLGFHEQNKVDRHLNNLG